MSDILSTLSLLLGNEAGGRLGLYLYWLLFGIGFKPPAHLLAKSFMGRPTALKEGHYPNWELFLSYRRFFVYVLSALCVFLSVLVGRQLFGLWEKIGEIESSVGFVVAAFIFIALALWWVFYKRYDYLNWHEGEHAELPRLRRAIDVVSQSMGLAPLNARAVYLQIPTIYIDKDLSGRPTFYATTGLLILLNDDELRAIVAQQYNLIRFDTLQKRDTTKILMMILFGLGVLSILLFMVPLFGQDEDTAKGAILVFPMFIYIAGVVSEFFAYVISAQETFCADLAAIEFTRFPQGLHSAFKKILFESDDYSPMPQRFQPKLLTAEASWFFRNPPYQPQTLDRIHVLEEVYGASPESNLKNFEKELFCPNCNHSMKDRSYVSRYGVESLVSECEQCGAYWFRVDQIAMLPEKFSLLSKEGLKNPALKCPVCGIQLKRQDLGYNFIKPLTCEGCGGNLFSSEELQEFMNKRITT